LTAVHVGKPVLAREIRHQVHTSGLRQDAWVGGQRRDRATDVLGGFALVKAELLLELAVVMSRTTRSVRMKPGMSVTAAIFFFFASPAMPCISKLMQR
jgi:hypothetical protein